MSRVAKYCAVASETVRRWRRGGKLKAAGRTPSGMWLFDPREVMAMLGVVSQPFVPNPTARPPTVASVPDEGERDPRDPSRPYECHIVDAIHRAMDGVDDFSAKLQAWVSRNRGQRVPTGVILSGLRSTYPEIARSKRISGSGLSGELKRLRHWLGIELEKGTKGGRVWVL